MWRTQDCYSYYCPSPLPDCWLLNVDFLSSSWCFCSGEVAIRTPNPPLFIRAWDWQWRVKDSELQQKVSVMWCNWCISTGRRFLACALRVGAIQPIRMELFQHMQQIFAFLSGAYQKTLKANLECVSMKMMHCGILLQLWEATTSPSSNEIIASQKDGCNLRDSTWCFVPLRSLERSIFFSLVFGNWMWLKNLTCPSRAVSQWANPAQDSFLPFVVNINMWPHNISAPPVEMVMGSALIRGFVQHLPLCSVMSPSINFVALEAAPQAGRGLKYLLQKTSLIFNLKHICKEEKSQSEKQAGRETGKIQET